MPNHGSFVSHGDSTNSELLPAPELIRLARDVLRWEANCLTDLAEQLGEPFVEVVRAILACRGKLVLTGMGKMGSIAHKATATFCSLGTPAVYLHPADGLHGDLGVAAPGDLLLALSNSGQTEEVAALLPYLHRRGIPVVAITSRPGSGLGGQADFILNLGIEREADPITAAPTASTTAALALCDALAVAVARCRGLTADQFALFHPGGFLGRRLLLTVGELMHSGQQLPLIGPDETLRRAIVEITSKALGAVFVVAKEGKLVGILTDGDLRRSLTRTANPLDEPVARHMTIDPRTITGEVKAVAALQLMEQHAITVLPVINRANEPVGAVHLHDLVQAGLGPGFGTA
ncbi:MAG: SIS domain-containing protein [Planctomycetota bacterium]